MTEKERKELELLREKDAKLKARNKANNEIIKRNFDRVSCTLPKGTKDRITAKGETINGLINKLVLEWIENNK